MKTRKRIIFGVYLLLSAVAVLIDVIGKKVGWLPADFLSLWKVLLGLLIVYCAVEAAISRRFWFIPWAGGCMFLVFEKEIANLAGVSDGNLAPVWVIFLAAGLLSLGIGLIFQKKRTPKKPAQTTSFQYNSGSNFTAKNNFGAKTIYIDCADFTEKTVENSFGALDIHFVNTEMFSGEGTLEIHNQTGAVNVSLPSDWSVTNEIYSSLGAVNIDVDGGMANLTLHLKGENNTGAINVEREKTPL